MYNLIWFFVVFATIYDLAFAYNHLDTINEWELNPAARWSISTFSFTFMVWYRLITIGLGWIFTKYTNFKWFITILMLFIHLFLMGIYIHG